MRGWHTTAHRACRNAGLPARIRVALEIDDCGFKQLFFGALDASALPMNVEFAAESQVVSGGQQSCPRQPRLRPVSTRHDREICLPRGLFLAAGKCC
jgi:hypothetical protein